MKDVEVNRSLSRPVKCLIVALLSLMFVVTLIPLWQIGAMSTANADAARVKAEAADMDREGRALRAAVAVGIPEIEGEYLLSASL